MNEIPMKVLVEFELSSIPEKQDFLNKFNNFSGRVVDSWIIYDNETMKGGKTQ